MKLDDMCKMISFKELKVGDYITSTHCSKNVFKIFEKNFKDKFFKAKFVINEYGVTPESLNENPRVSIAPFNRLNEIYKIKHET